MIAISLSTTDIDATSGTVWSPTGIATLLWIDPSDSGSVSSTGGLVDSINDKSGNGLHFSGVTTTRPDIGTNTLNGLNVLTFASATRLTADSTTGWNWSHDATDVAFFIVARVGTSADPNMIITLLGSNANSIVNKGMSLYHDTRNGVRSDALVALVSGSDVNTYLLSQTALAPSDGSLATQTWAILRVIKKPADGTAANRLQVRVGAVDWNNNASAITSYAGVSTHAMQINAGGNNTWNTGTLRIAEIVAITNNAENNTRVSSYLSHKWGV